MSNINEIACFQLCSKSVKYENGNSDKTSNQGWNERNIR